MKLALLALLLVALARRAEAQGAEIAVEPTGDDAGPGTPERPFATLHVGDCR